ncbi:DUF6912 family protein [Williamsia deligens]|uniref:DUF6912 family protein n=1 Tax=Williamsia deligens TaxID=321325 RepID=A0ABW3G6G7_9NOCA|nr:hypothetical protein [Williamsia deligens]MCP2194800.1 hypothetical protein [Williamsia deligens]
MRVYIPATLTMVADLTTSGTFESVGGTAFALTPALRESYTSGDDEELAEAAMREAARASLRLLSAEADAPPRTAADDDTDGDRAPMPPRRVVVAADVEPVTLRPDLDTAVVKIPPSVPRSAIASVHVDVSEAEAAVVAAMSAVDAADLGDEDAELAVGDVDDHDLAWYATQEIPFLLELL